MIIAAHAVEARAPLVIYDMAFRLIPGNVLSLEDGTVEV
jgi:hypothetical protein